MNCYTVSAGRVSPGIATTDDHIRVGEAGRNRKLVRVPVPTHAVMRGDILDTAPMQQETDALLLIRDQSGFRGDWVMCAPRSEKGYVFVALRQRSHRPPDGQGPLAEGHDLMGKCAACAALPGGDRLPEQWRVVAEGRCAQGDAGAMGGGSEYLLVLPAGAGLHIRRGGRLYGAPEMLLVSNTTGVVTVSDPIAAAESRLATTAGAW